MTPPTDPKPARKLAVVTCMDCRIDVDSVLGIEVGDAHVIRNGGGRVTDDVLRSLAISVRLLGVENVIVMEHTKCGLAGTTEESMRERTGASDVTFLVIEDHEAAIRADVDALSRVPYLPLQSIEGRLYDLDADKVVDVCRWERG